MGFGLRRDAARTGIRAVLSVASAYSLQASSYADFFADRRNTINFPSCDCGPVVTFVVKFVGLWKRIIRAISNSYLK